MKKYLTSKGIIEAKAMNRGAYNRGYRIESNEKVSDEGYLVKQQGCDAFWIAKDVFEKMYISTEENERVLEGQWKVAVPQNEKENDKLSFGHAIEAVKKGRKVARKGWKAKGHYLFVAAGEDLTACLSSGDFKCESAICVKMSHDNVGIGWNPSQADMLAEDWVIVN